MKEKEWRVFSHDDFLGFKKHAYLSSKSKINLLNASLSGPYLEAILIREGEPPVSWEVLLYQKISKNPANSSNLDQALNE